MVTVVIKEVLGWPFSFVPGKYGGTESYLLIIVLELIYNEDMNLKQHVFIWCDWNRSDMVGKNPQKFFFKYLRECTVWIWIQTSGEEYVKRIHKTVTAASILQYFLQIA